MPAKAPRSGFSYTPEEAFTSYSDMVFAVSYSRLNANYDYAQDVTAEVFFRLLKYKPAIKSQEHLKAWLIRAAINCSNTLMNSPWQRRTCELTENAVEAGDSPERVVIVGEQQRMVYNAVLCLPPNHRTAIHLFYYEDMTIEQIALAMSANKNTVKSWLKRGREQLRELLSEVVD